MIEQWTVTKLKAKTALAHKSEVIFTSFKIIIKHIPQVHGYLFNWSSAFRLSKWVHLPIRLVVLVFTAHSPGPFWFIARTWISYSVSLCKSLSKQLLFDRKFVQLNHCPVYSLIRTWKPLVGPPPESKVSGNHVTLNFPHCFSTILIHFGWNGTPLEKK